MENNEKENIKLKNEFLNEKRIEFVNNLYENWKNKFDNNNNTKGKNKDKLFIEKEKSEEKRKMSKQKIKNYRGLSFRNKSLNQKEQINIRNYNNKDESSLKNKYLSEESSLKNKYLSEEKDRQKVVIKKFRYAEAYSKIFFYDKKMNFNGKPLKNNLEQKKKKDF